jgi:hypothetical protein
MKTVMGLLARSLFQIRHWKDFQEPNLLAMTLGKAYCAASLRALIAAGTNQPSKFCIVMQNRWQV